MELDTSIGVGAFRRVLIAGCSVIANNGLDGMRGRRVRLVNATTTGNGTDPACGVSVECADVASDRKPSVVGASTCEVSRNPLSGGDWDVCALD